MKECYRCGVEKELSEFNNQAQKKDGKQPHCRECDRSRNKELGEQKRQDPVYVAQKREYHKNYRETQGEELLKKKREYYKENREEILEKQRQINLENPERNRNRVKQWVLENPEKRKAQRRNREAMERAAEGMHTGEEIIQMISDQDGLCAYCEVPLNEEYHVDHMVPLSKGGTNWWDNLAITCPDCNMRKHTMSLIEFMERQVMP